MASQTMLNRQQRRLIKKHQPQRGLDAIASIEARHTRTGKWGVSGPELTALGDALNLMDQLMLVVRRVDMARHVKAVLGV